MKELKKSTAASGYLQMFWRIVLSLLHCQNFSQGNFQKQGDGT
jgi:hypothetical protein